MTARRAALAVFLECLAIGMPSAFDGVASAQTATRARSVRAPVVVGIEEAAPVDESTAAAAEQSPATGSQATDSSETSTSKPEESARMTRLKALTYDRRPSAILKAWADVEADDAEQAPESGAANANSSDAEPTAEGAAENDDASDRPKAADGDSEEAAAAKAAAEALDRELKNLQRNVTLGRWDEVRKYLAEIPEDEGQAGYAQMLKSLSSPPAVQGQPQQQQQQITVPGVGPIGETHQFALDDILGLAAACPHELERDSVKLLGTILRQAMQTGLLVETVLERLNHEAELPEDEATLSRVQCAWLLESAGQLLEIEPFLPTAGEAIADGDAETLILLARSVLAQYERDGTPELLERTWSTLQSVAALQDVDDEQQQTALRMTMDLLPRIRDEVSDEWLEQRFAGAPERGMEIIELTGSSTAAGLQANATNPSARLANLRLQKLMIETLLESDSERAAEWRDTLALLAFAWLREAEVSRALDRAVTSRPQLQRDPYGNLFYVNNAAMQQAAQSRQKILAIGTADVLEVAPNEQWLQFVPETMRPNFDRVTAQLHLKVSEDEEAFPYIEKLARSHPDLGRDLVHEFIRVWTRNHDPNSGTRYTSPYMYIYGFERRAGSIPLTRSKQERNLEELAGWVRRIRELPIDDLDESLFARAFTTCHSRAEVYRIEGIEKVFGSIGNLDPETLAQFVQQMRGNLGSVWRLPSEQDAAQTHRKQKDIEAEVTRGYTVAATVVGDAIEKYPDDWSLHLAQACLMLDQLAYEIELEPNSEFSARRSDILERFGHAAELYAATVPTLKETEQTAEVYERWFYAALGASDLNRIDHKSTPDPRQPALIRAAMLALPGEAAEHHIGLFANSLFTRMSGLNPAVKFSYLDAGFEIAGDAEQAIEARKVYDYYRDLITEIKLVTHVDGSARVGADGPFGVFVDLLHTREIERESGGFGKYLQNQNAMAYAYNYGRPLENYRDKFEEAARVALDENFDVLSITFQEPDVHSRAADEYGWRVTPYAYLLLQPRGPQVDKLPALKIDLDFLDTSGYAVLPVTSAPLPIDAADRPEPRPYENLQITQTLDERQAADGKLILEVRASSRGLVPALDDIMDVRSSDFEVTGVDDEGVLISRFDPESSAPAVISERTWTVNYAGRSGLDRLPTEFRYPEPKPTANVAEVSYLRYNDADLETVDPTVMLEQEYGEVARVWPWYLAGGVLVLIAAGFGLRALIHNRAEQADEGFRLPEHLTPFNVLTLLRDLERKNGFDSARQAELSASIQTLERYYFAGGNGHEEPNLRQVAEHWLVRS